MESTFFDEDRVITLNWFKPKVRDVVVFYYKREIYIKRINKITEGKFIVEGDHKTLSSKISPIFKKQIIGKVVWSY